MDQLFHQWDVGVVNLYTIPMTNVQHKTIDFRVITSSIKFICPFNLDGIEV
jgi:hypothetical protein